MHRAAARRPDDARVQIGGDVGYLCVGGFHLDDLRVFRRPPKLRELAPIFVVQSDDGRNEIGAGLAAFAALSVAVAAGGIIERKAAVDGVVRINNEPGTSAAAPT